MKILYYASILTGELDAPEFYRDEDEDATSPDKSGAKPTSSQAIQVRVYNYFIIYLFAFFYHKNTKF